MIKANLDRIHQTMAEAAQRAGRRPDEIMLVAVTKQVDAVLIEEAMACGQLLFGESYLQEAAAKIPHVKGRASWHCIGHLQSNKAAQAAALFDVIETVDSLKLARLLDRHAKTCHRRLSALVQVNTSGERQKSGVAPTEAESLLRAIAVETDLRVTGLMTIPPYSPEGEHSRPYFRRLAQLAAALACKGLFVDNNRVELSMGMSGDYPVAIEEGATMVRIGTALFGA